MRFARFLLDAPLFGTAAAAQAGCLTDAIVGGVAGHMVGHGELGAAAGCAAGHHHAKKKERKQARPAPGGRPKQAGRPRTIPDELSGRLHARLTLPG